VAFLRLPLCALALAASLARADDTRSEPACTWPARVFEGGAPGELLCPERAHERGLTIIDLSNAWAPRVLREPAALGHEAAPVYLASYLALADERPEALPKEQPFERYLELYGIVPSLRVVRARLLDEPAHACAAAVPLDALRALDRVLSSYRPDLATQRARVQRIRDNTRFLEHVRDRLGLPSIDALEGDPRYVFAVRSLRRDRATVGAIEATQDRLRCSGRLPDRFERGVFDARTTLALRDFQREHVIISSGMLDADTRAAVSTDSRELVFRAALRALRERVADAAGLIEDGSASGRFGTVLGRTLDPDELLAASTYPPLPDAAEDLISPATEAAARALGWTDPAALAAFFTTSDDAVLEHLQVAVRLPPPPAYHAAHMELRAELDRGDVWYGYPFRPDGALRRSPARVRPSVILYARDGERTRPLVRFQTTIGGWQPEQIAPGHVGLRYKESPVGPRLWRDLIAAPVWLPPPSTPDAELLEHDGTPRLRAKDALLGPGHRSAYGLVMLVHGKPSARPRASSASGAPPVAEPTEPERATPEPDDYSALDESGCCYDQGVRTHGSQAYGSILRGYSHGCHRLFNHLALRLGAFLLAHRHHLRHGPLATRYDRVLRRGEAAVLVKRSSRGYRYELTPPVPIEVLEGHVVGMPKQAIHGLRPLRQSLVARVAAAATGQSGGGTSAGASAQTPPSEGGANPPD